MAMQFSCSDSRLEFSSLSCNFRIGDTLAENAIFSRLVEPLNRLIRRRLTSFYQSKFSAEDIVQATFMSFMKRHREQPFEIQIEGALWAIMSQIALRKCANEIKRYQRDKRDVRKEVVQLPNAKEQSTSRRSFTSREPDPQSVAESQETVRRLLVNLTAKQRELVVLRMRGYENSEIAQKLNVSERSVYRMLNDVRFHIKRLQQVLVPANPN